MTNTQKSPAATFADLAQEITAEVHALENALYEHSSNPSLPQIIWTAARTHAYERMHQAAEYGHMAMQMGMK